MKKHKKTVLHLLNVLVFYALHLIFRDCTYDSCHIPTANFSDYTKCGVREMCMLKKEASTFPHPLLEYNHVYTFFLDVLLSTCLLQACYQLAVAIPYKLHLKYAQLAYVYDLKDYV